MSFSDIDTELQDLLDLSLEIADQFGYLKVIEQYYNSDKIKTRYKHFFEMFTYTCYNSLILNLAICFDPKETNNYNFIRYSNEFLLTIEQKLLNDGLFDNTYVQDLKEALVQQRKRILSYSKDIKTLRSKQIAHFEKYANIKRVELNEILPLVKDLTNFITSMALYKYGVAMSAKFIYKKDIKMMIESLSCEI